MASRMTTVASLAAGLALVVAPAAVQAGSAKVTKKTYTVKLAGANEVPPVPPVTDIMGNLIPLTGKVVITAQVTRKTGATKVCVTIKNWVDDASMFSNYAIFKGAAGQTGKTVVPLFKHVVPLGHGSTGVCQLHTKAAVVEAILKKPQGYYFNIQTEKHPDGSLRGQLKG